MLLLLACWSSEPEPPAAQLPFVDRPTDAKRGAAAFPSSRVKDRAGWSTDVHAIFAAHDIRPTNGNLCAVVATVEQESGYEPDPAVPGIGGMIDTWIAEKQAELGALPAWAFGAGLRAVLDTKAPGKPSFYDRLRSARTERDVDIVFREFVDFHRSKLPEPLRAAEGAAQFVGLDLDDLNPITTAGCLQVKVDQAEDHAASHGTKRDLVRDSLYTREGCLHYGVVRLLDWDASYDKPLYRFADYNAGYYASRNAAFQEQLGIVADRTIALDGDLLRYDKDGSPASTASQTLELTLAVVKANQLDIPEGRVKKDLAREKLRDFEDTKTWAGIRALYQKKTSKKPSYARLPDVELASIKFKDAKSTAWFAQNVDKRYGACLERLKKG